MRAENGIRRATAALIESYLRSLPEPKRAPLEIKVYIRYGDGAERHEIDVKNDKEK